MVKREYLPVAADCEYCGHAVHEAFVERERVREEVVFACCVPCYMDALSDMQRA